MKTLQLDEMNDFIENLVISYESRLHNIETVFNTSEAISESSQNLFKDLQLSLVELRKERTHINDQLRESLAKNGSLRKKDYDKMMKGILLLLEKKEKEAENYFAKYIEDQKALASFIKKGLLEIKDASSKNNNDSIKSFKKELNNITQEQELMKNKVIQHFLTYQNIHNTTTGHLKILLKKRDTILVKDIKKIVKFLINELQ